MMFAIPGEVMGKGRPRFRVSGGHVHTYTPPETKAYEQEVGAIYKKFGGKLYEGPVGIDVVAYFKIPKKVGLKTKELMEKGTISPTKRPDADNIMKIIMDGLNGIAYKDDSQVICLTCSKRYTSGEPYVAVQVTEKLNEIVF